MNIKTVLLFKATFLVSFCLASGIVTSERSIQDSDFSLKAQQVMQAAMRLPPHILPTLDELDGKVKSLKNKNVGVYVPGKSKPVGIYIPKNQGKLKKKSPHKKQASAALKLTPDLGQRYKRKTKKRQKSHREKIPIFAVALEPESPLGKLYDLSKDQSQKLMTQLGKVRLKKPPSYLKRHQKPFYERERHLFKHTSPTPHPYKFEEANFQLLERADYGSIRKSSSTGKNKLRQAAQVHKFVPFVVKEALAKSFLKRPERYLQRLYAKQQRKKSRLSPLQRSRRKQQNQAAITSDFKVPKVKYSQVEERQKSPSDSLNFDSNFPWEKNSASLVKYDSLASFQGSSSEEAEKQSTEADEAFKSGEFLGWEPARRRRRRKGQESIQQEPVTKTLCFCCEEEENQEAKKVFLSSDFSHRRKRTLKIQDVHQSQQVFKHKEYIHDSLTCLDQDPIEVILVFGPSSTSTSTEAPALNIPPQLSETFYQNYDPIKLQIHDETSQPSPFQRRKGSDTLVDEPNETIEAQLNRLLNSVQNKVETVDAVQLESSLEEAEEKRKTDVKSSELSEPSRPAAILRQQPSKPLVNTLPGYNILRLLTGG